MVKFQRALLLLAVCVTISACDMATTHLASGGITLKDDIVSLHVKDIPDAMIDASGSLSIDGKSIAVTSPQRGLLMLYQRAVMDVHDTGLAMGKIGAGMGTQAIKNAVDGKSKAEQDKDAEAGSAKMDQLFQKMCDDEASIKSLQDQLAVQLPAFKPYGSILSSEEVTECYKDKH